MRNVCQDSNAIIYVIKRESGLAKLTMLWYNYITYQNKSHEAFGNV